MIRKAETSADGAGENTQTAGSRVIEIANHRLESRDLFVGTKEITIGHEGETYRLRLTALNKLILTK